MSTQQTVERSLHCSFCAKPKAEVDKIIAGPGVYICDACVRLCETILAQAAEPGEAAPQPEIPVAERMTDDEILALLPRIAAVSDQVDTSLESWVARLRTRGVSWARIGEALGMARQSAWERFTDQP